MLKGFKFVPLKVVAPGLKKPLEEPMGKTLSVPIFKAALGGSLDLVIGGHRAYSPP